MKAKLRLVLGPIIIALTFGVFIYYVKTHPAVIHALKTLDPLALAMLLALYMGTNVAMMLQLKSQVKLYQKHIPTQENFLLNAYSSLVNFFAPGQSGPGLRAVYLKRKYGIKLRQYTFATLLYYAFYAVVSAFFLFVGSRPWWQTFLLVAAVGLFSVAVIRYFVRRDSKTKHVAVKGLALGLFLATFLQLAIIALIYYVELHGVDPHVSFAQAITYTGVANFALFVSLTPGAIGIRETFLVFSHDLHHISNSTVVAASVVDRAVYLLFLGILFLFVISMHAKKRLNLSSKTLGEQPTDASQADKS